MQPIVRRAVDARHTSSVALVEPAQRSFASAGVAATVTGVVLVTTACQLDAPRDLNFIADAVEGVMPAVVSIEFRVQTPAAVVQQQDSGVIIDASGLVLTTVRAVTGENVIVTLADGRKFRGRVEALSDTTGLALLQLTPLRDGDAEPRDLPTAPIGNPNKLRPGQWVASIGSPHSLSGVITAGIVSGPPLAGERVNFPSSAKLIRTDALTPDDNLGGPLVNMAGEVVGIAVKQSLKQFGVALPIDFAMRVVKELQASGSGEEPWMGLRLVDVTAEDVAALRAKMPSFPESVKDGVLVLKVVDGSPAVEAGVQPGDVIVWANKKPVRTSEDLHRIITAKANKPVLLEVKRGATRSKRLTIVPRRRRGRQWTT